VELRRFASKRCPTVEYTVKSLAVSRGVRAERFAG
jgi:hypothetical protein